MYKGVHKYFTLSFKSFPLGKMPKNGGGIVRAILMKEECNLDRLEMKKGPEHRRKKRRLVYIIRLNTFYINRAIQNNQHFRILFQ